MSYLDVNGKPLDDKVLDEWAAVIAEIQPATELEGMLAATVKDFIEDTKVMLHDLQNKESVIQVCERRLSQVAANAEAYAAHVIACHASGKPPASYAEWYLYEVAMKYRQRWQSEPSSNS